MLSQSCRLDLPCLATPRRSDSFNKELLHATIEADDSWFLLSPTTLPCRTPTSPSNLGSPLSDSEDTHPTISSSASPVQAILQPLPSDWQSFPTGVFSHVRRHLFISPYSATRLARVAKLFNITSPRHNDPTAFSSDR